MNFRGSQGNVHGNQHYVNQCKKLLSFKKQCKGDISHAFETAKITVFHPTLCKTPDAPLQNELLY